MTRDQKIAVAKSVAIAATTVAIHIGARRLIGKTIRDAFPIPSDTSR